MAGETLASTALVSLLTCFCLTFIRFLTNCTETAPDDSQQSHNTSYLAFLTAFSSCFSRVPFSLLCWLTILSTCVLWVLCITSCSCNTHRNTNTTCSWNTHRNTQSHLRIHTNTPIHTNNHKDKIHGAMQILNKPTCLFKIRKQKQNIPFLFAELCKSCNTLLRQINNSAMVWWTIDVYLDKGCQRWHI